MKTVLLISSLVSSSQVGATASAFCLRRLGLDVNILPTTLFGRHPGWGVPGGQAVDVSVLRDMWAQMKDQNIAYDAVMTGYMAAQDHIDMAVTIIKSLQREMPNVKILVDPVKGDDGRLYIPKHRAQALRAGLVPLADMLTPNLYELSYMAGRPLTSLHDICRAARDIGNDLLVTSVPYKGQIGAALVSPTHVSYVGHEHFDKVPNGGGDSLAALFLAHRLSGETPRRAQQLAVSSIFAILTAAQHAKQNELPLTQYQNHLITPPLLDIQDIDL